MAEYQVPQFIEVEDKIFGPFTLRQFIFVAGGVGICVGLILYLPRLLGIALAIPVAVLAWALAFFRYNERTFLEIVEAGFNYYSKNRLYLWRKDDKAEGQAMAVSPVPAAPPVQKLGLNQSKLKDLAWALDIQDKTEESA